MKIKSILAIALILAMACVCIIPADDSDAAKVQSITLDNGKNINISSGDSITLSLTYTSTSNPSCTITVYETSNPSKKVLTQDVIFKAGETITLTLDPFKMSGSSSTNMCIEFSNDVYDKLYFTVNFTKSPWDNWGIYAAIAIVAILIIIFVVWKTRNTPKEKNQLTFEQVEAQKQAEKAAVAGKKEPVKSERQRYLKSKKK